MKKVSKTKLTILIATLLTLIHVGVCLGGEEVILKAGTAIPIRLLDTVDSKTATAGSIVRAEVTRDILVDDKVAVKRGTEVVIEIAYADKEGSLGKEGAVCCIVRHTTAVDGTRVPLRAKLEKTGKEKVALSWLVCPFIKGGGAKIDAGTETKGYIDNDTKIIIH